MTWWDWLPWWSVMGTQAQGCNPDNSGSQPVTSGQRWLGRGAPTLCLPELRVRVAAGNPIFICCRCY